MLDWLNANELRAYPFADGSPAGGYLRAVVDAAFYLGQDVPYDLQSDSTSWRLATVALSGVDWVLTFRHYYAGTAVSGSPEMVFRVGVGTARHATVTATTASGQSRGMLTFGDVQALQAGAPEAVVVDHAVVAAAGNPGLLRVYNAERRTSYRPQYASTSNGAGADYAAAKAATNEFKRNVVLTSGTTVSSRSPTIAGGNNVVVDGDAGTHIVRFRFGVGLGLGRDCTAMRDLGVVPADTTYEGTLQHVNELTPSNGDLELVFGSKFKVVGIPDQNLVRVVVDTPIADGDCLSPRSR